MKPIVLPVFCLMMFIAGCSKESVTPEPITPTAPQKTEIRISPSVAESRATDYGFESGDCIGLYVVNYNGTDPGNLISTGNHVDNMRFTYNGTWIPDIPIHWLDDKTHADFYLYYPYTAVTSVAAHQFEVRANQSAEEDYKASDFMLGKATNTAPTEGAIMIPAKHLMSRIIISLLAGNGFTSESLAASDIAVKINGVKCSSTINIATGDIIATGSASAVIPLCADGAYKALIIPQTVAEGNLITVTVDGSDFNLTKAFTFESTKSHKFTVTLSKTTNGVNVTINPWVDDGTDNGGIAD